MYVADELSAAARPEALPAMDLDPAEGEGTEQITIRRRKKK